MSAQLIVIERDRSNDQIFLGAYGPFDSFDEAEEHASLWREMFFNYFSVGRLDASPEPYHATPESAPRAMAPTPDRGRDA